MRWKYKEKPKWRTKTRFAFFPVRTTLPSNDVVLWLEFYQTNERLEYDWGSDECWHIHQIAPIGYWSNK